MDEDVDNDDHHGGLNSSMVKMTDEEDDNGVTITDHDGVEDD